MLSRLMVCSVLSLLIFVTACSSGTDNSQTSSTPNASPAATTAPTASSPKAKLNINTASGAEFLSAIPNLGNRMVHEFEEYRPYKSIQQFRKEIGKYVDQNQVAEYEKYIFVPIDETSDAATLQQIPGLDANEAEELIPGDPMLRAPPFWKSSQRRFRLTSWRLRKPICLSHDRGRSSTTAETFLLLLSIVLFGGALVELWLVEHTQDVIQWLAFVLAGAGALAALLVLLRPGRASVRVMRVCMIWWYRKAFRDLRTHRRQYCF